jgi:hypothetical protein
MSWNLASPDFNVSLSFDVDSQHGGLNGTLKFRESRTPFPDPGLLRECLDEAHLLSLS